VAGCFGLVPLRRVGIGRFHHSSFQVGSPLLVPLSVQKSEAVPAPA
jgi:hypothetical protein